MTSVRRPWREVRDRRSPEGAINQTGPSLRKGFYLETSPVVKTAFCYTKCFLNRRSPLFAGPLGTILSASHRRIEKKKTEEYYHQIHWNTSFVIQLFSLLPPSQYTVYPSTVYIDNEPISCMCVCIHVEYVAFYLYVCVCVLDSNESLVRQ